MKNIFLKSIVSLFIASIMLTSCNDDENFTNHGTIDATSKPIVSIDFPQSSPIILVESDSKYPFSINIPNAVNWDVVLKLGVSESNATNGEDFIIPNEIVIPAGSKTASATIEILSDDLIEMEESFTISIGDIITGGTTTPKIITFTISNLSSGDLNTALSWASSEKITDNRGDEISATDLADLKLLLVDVDGNILKEYNTPGFESFDLPSLVPDGDYYIAAEWVSRHPEVQVFYDIDLTVTFNQVGVINDEILSFPKALNSEFTCPNTRFNLVKISKSGLSHEFSSFENAEVNLADFVGTWSGAGSWNAVLGYGCQIVTTMDANGDLWLNGATFEWFQDWWGEVIIENTPVKIGELGPCGDFTIATQPYLESTWNGAPQPAYTLQGNGKLTIVGGVPTIEFYPVLIQQGTYIIDGTAWGPRFFENATL